MKSRGIKEDHLTPFDMFNAENLVSCGLGFFGDDGDLFAQDAIEKSRFSDIGPSQDRDETAFKRTHNKAKILNPNIEIPAYRRQAKQKKVVIARSEATRQSHEIASLRSQ
jgi:hypothetical protein